MNAPDIKRIRELLAIVKRQRQEERERRNAYQRAYYRKQKAKWEAKETQADKPDGCAPFRGDRPDGCRRSISRPPDRPTAQDERKRPQERTERKPTDEPDEQRGRATGATAATIRRGTGRQAEIGAGQAGRLRTLPR